MSQAQTSFAERCKRIDTSHRKTATGYSLAVDRRSGLIIAKPRRSRINISLRGIVYLVASVFLFKALLIAHLGEASYQQRIATLKAGTVVEQVGASLMTLDPTSQLIASYMRPYIR